LKVHLHQSSKYKVIKKSKTEEIRVFPTFFADNGRIRIHNRIRTNNDGSGSWRPKSIRIRIHNTGNNIIHQYQLAVVVICSACRRFLQKAAKKQVEGGWILLNIFPIKQVRNWTTGRFKG
jgi:hypothetical protein